MKSIQRKKLIMHMKIKLTHTMRKPSTRNTKHQYTKKRKRKRK